MRDEKPAPSPEDGYFMKQTIRTLLLIASLGGAGCASTPYPVLRANSANVEVALKAILAQDVRFSTTTNVRVNPSSGVVTLSGQVASDADREAAGKFAMIYNELHVAATPR